MQERSDNNIQLFLYLPVNKGIGKQLRSMIERLIPTHTIEVHQNIETFAHRLRKRTNDQLLVVLLAVSRGDLLELLSIRDLLRDVRIILILPDRDESTVAKGHMLRPRFLSYTDGGFTDVFSVLKKCLASYTLKV